MKNDTRRSALELLDENIITECIINYKDYGTILLESSGLEIATVCIKYDISMKYPIYIKDAISYSFHKSNRYISIVEKITTKGWYAIRIIQW